MRYYYVDAEGRQQGPVEASELAGYGVTANTYVYCEGMTNWTLAAQVSDVMQHLGAAVGLAVPPPPQTEIEAEDWPKSYLARSIVGLCLSIIPVYFIGLTVAMPFGVLGIVFSILTRSKRNAGQMELAQRFSGKARGFSLTVLIMGIVCWAFFLFLLILVAAGNDVF